MRKLAVIVCSALLMLFASSAVAMNCGDHGKMEGKKHCDMGKDGDCIMNFDADYSVKDTADGVVITIKARKGGVEAKTIQEKSKKCVEMCAGKKGVKAADGDEMVTCAVMGVKMKKDKAYESIEYEGKTYYFCCAGCKEKFLKDPKKYIKN